MGFFDFLNSVKAQANKQFNPEYSKNKDFLEAVAAGAAFVAAADGTIDDSERKALLEQLSTHKVLGVLYGKEDIASTADSMLAKATSNAGKAQLVREIDDVKGKGKQIAEDVYAICVDVAMADGTISDAEQNVLDRLAKRLGVDTEVTL